MGVFMVRQHSFPKMASRDVKSTKNQFELPPRPWLYDEYTMSSIGFSFQLILRGVWLVFAEIQ